MVKDMTTGNPTKLLLAFAVPMLIGNIFQQFYSMVDTMIVGRFVGVNALAGVGSTGSMNFLVLGFVNGLAVGFSIIVAQYFGAGDEKKLRRSVAMSTYLAIGLGILLTILSLLFTRPLLELMNTPSDIIDHAYTYISIIFAGIGITFAYNLLASILRALGDSKTPLYCLIVASIVNVVLDLVFVINFSMGVAGAAWATIIAQIVSCIMCLFYIKKKCAILKMHKEDWILDLELCKKLMKMGIPTAFQFSITAVGVMILQSTVNGFGSTTVAAYTAATKVEQLASQPAATLGVAMATYAGQNLGAKKFDRIHLGIKKCVMISMVICIGGGLLVSICGGFLTTLFVSAEHQEVIALSKQYIITVSLFFWVLGLLFIYRNALQGLGNAVVTLWSGVTELVMRIGVALILSKLIAYQGICFAGPIAWVAATIFLIISYHKHIKKLETQHLATQNAGLAL